MWLFWAGARLTVLDKTTRFYTEERKENRAIVLAAERVLNHRINACRKACIAILVCMPGDRSCTRDWVRRFLWPTRDRRFWAPQLEMSNDYKREEDDDE